MDVLDRPTRRAARREGTALRDCADPSNSAVRLDIVDREAGDA